jgi:hypothetical protein
VIAVSDGTYASGTAGLMAAHTLDNWGDDFKAFDDAGAVAGGDYLVMSRWGSVRRCWCCATATLSDN